MKPNVIIQSTIKIQELIKSNIKMIICEQVQRVTKQAVVEEVALLRFYIFSITNAIIITITIVIINTIVTIFSICFLVIIIIGIIIVTIVNNYHLQVWWPPWSFHHWRQRP